jgi:hypothetical protein
MQNIADKNIKLELIQDLTWPEVFAIWRQNEEYPGSHWHSHYQNRGFKTWEEWRLSYVQPFGLARLKWQLYKVTEPLQAVPLMHGGPFRSWVQYFYQGQTAPTFTDLAKNPAVQNHQGVLNFMKNFPAETKITGVVLNGKIIIMEGMHRCCALALAASQNIKIKTKIQIALAEHDQTGLPVVGQQLKK